jgi:hypothetical protein
MSRGGRGRLAAARCCRCSRGAEIAVLRFGREQSPRKRARQGHPIVLPARCTRNPRTTDLLHLVGEAPVVVERGARPLQESLKGRVVAQVRGRRALEDRKAGARARLGKGNVEPTTRPVAREELMQHQRRACRDPRASVLGAEDFARRCRRSRHAGRAFRAGTGAPSRHTPSVRAASAHGTPSSLLRRRADTQPAPVRFQRERGCSARTSGSSGGSLPRGALCCRRAKHRGCCAGWGVAGIL